MKLFYLLLSSLIFTNIIFASQESDDSYDEEERVEIRVHTPQEEFSPTLVKIICPARQIVVAELKNAIGKKLGKPEIRQYSFMFNGVVMDDKASISTKGLHSCQALQHPMIFDDSAEDVKVALHKMKAAKLVANIQFDYFMQALKENKPIK